MTPANTLHIAQLTLLGIAPPLLQSSTGAHAASQSAKTDRRAQTKSYSP